MDYKSWNDYINNSENEEVSVLAEPGDIVTEKDGVLFLCQRKDNYNNIVCIRIKPSKVSIIETFFNYVLWLKSNGVEFIRIEGRKGRYKFLERTFTKKGVVKDESISNRDVYYCKLPECKKTIEKYLLKKTEDKYYFLQKKYNETADQKTYEEMFMIMKFAIENSIKKKLNGIIRTDIYDLTMDATINVMSRYRVNQQYNIRYLLTAAHYAAVGILYNNKTKLYDRTTSYESLLDSRLLEEGLYE